MRLKVPSFLTLLLLLSGLALGQGESLKGGLCESDPGQKGLSAKQLQVLCHLDQSGHRLTSPWQPGFTATVLKPGSDEKCDHSIVLLAEEHFKTFTASEYGKKILANFRFRGFEKAPAEDFEKLNGSLGIKVTLAQSGFFKKLTEMNVISGSTIQDLQASGISTSSKFLANDETVWSSNFIGLAHFLSFRGKAGFEFYLDQLSNKGACWNPRAKPPREIIEALTDGKKFLTTFSDLIKNDPASSFNFHLEVGSLQSYDYNCKVPFSSSCQSYIVDARNERMARNIKSLVALLPCGEPFLVVVGSAHLPGLTKLLNPEMDYKAFQY
jgi:hypothetical protein